MMWEDSLFIDTTLPFGLRSAPKIFTAVADAVEWILKHEGVRFAIHYLDDFLVMGASGAPECGTALEKLGELLRRLGLPIAEEKREGPTTVLEFLGFEVDSGAMTVRLPERKVEELANLLAQWNGKRGAKRRELDSLVGKLAHASQVVQPGKTFMRRLFELQKGRRKPYHQVRLCQSMQSDLQWWATFVSGWNGVNIIGWRKERQRPVQVWTDASGNFGCRAVVPEVEAWLQLPWPESYAPGLLVLKEESITLKELLPVVLACAVWGEQWRERVVHVHCDNLGVVALVNSGYSKVPPIMHLLRCLFFIRAHFQIEVLTVHVPGVENSLADAISRNNLQTLFLQVPGAVARRAIIPANLLSLLVERQPD